MNDNNVVEYTTLNEFFLKFINFVFYVLRKWKQIFIFSFFGCLIGYVFSLYTESIFKAEFKFIVKDEKPLSLNSAFASSLGFDLNLIEDSRIYSTNTFIELFQSRRIIEKSLLKTVVYKRKEITLAEYFFKLYNFKSISSINLTNLFPFPPKREFFSRNQDSLLSLIYNDIINDKLKLERSAENKVIFIAQMKSKSEEFSIRFLTSIFDVILDDFKLMKIKNINTIKQRIDSLKIETNEILLNNTLSTSSTTALSKLNLNIPTFALQNIDLDLNMKMLTKLNEQLETSKLNLLNDSQLIQIIDSPAYPLPDLKKSRVFLITLFGSLFGLLIIFYMIIRRCLVLK